MAKLLLEIPTAAIQLVLAYFYCPCITRFYFLWYFIADPCIYDPAGNGGREWKQTCGLAIINLRWWLAGGNGVC